MIIKKPVGGFDLDEIMRNYDDDIERQKKEAEDAVRQKQLKEAEDAVGQKKLEEARAKIKKLQREKEEDLDIDPLQNIRLPRKVSADGIAEVKDINHTVVGYLFPDIAYNTRGDKQDFILTATTLQNNGKRTHSAWITYSQQNAGKIFVANSILDYQMKLRLFILRNNPKYEMIVNNCVSGLRIDYLNDFLHTGTSAEYGEALDSVVKHLQPDKTIENVTIEIPEFTVYERDQKWSYCVLAPARSEDQLDVTFPLPHAFHNMLKTYFGPNYEQAGSVFQYIGPRGENDALYPVRLWVPSAKERNKTFSLVLGFINGIYGFGIGTVEKNGCKPTHGVRQRKITKGAP